MDEENARLTHEIEHSLVQRFLYWDKEHFDGLLEEYTFTMG